MAAGQTAAPGCQDVQQGTLGAVGLAGAPARQAGAVAVLTAGTRALGWTAAEDQCLFYSV